MRKVKPLSEYQKGIYGEILGEFFNPIFSTGTSKSLKNSGLEDFLSSNSDTSLPLNGLSEPKIQPVRHGEKIKILLK